jgi:hypothetical protein
MKPSEYRVSPILPPASTPQQLLRRPLLIRREHHAEGWNNGDIELLLGERNASASASWILSGRRSALGTFPRTIEKRGT